MAYSESKHPAQSLPPPPTSPGRFRRLGQLLLLVLVPIILLGGLVLGFRMLSRSGESPTTASTAAVLVETPTQPPPVPSVAPTPLSVNTLIPTLTPTPAPTPTATEIPTPVPPEQIVALVNGQMVTTDTVRVVQAVDAAMSELLGRPADTQGTLLDRVINLVLTGQAADRAGFVLDPGVVTTTQDRLLADAGRTLDDLSRVLAQRNLTLAQFQAYLGQLLRSEQFLRQQAQSLGSTTALVLQRTQGDAQISLGLAAADLAALPTPVSTPTATPASTEEPTEAPVADAATPFPVLVERVRGISPGQLLPDFALPVVSFDGGPSTISLSADDLIGYPTVLSFYTTWCPYCERQTPILVESYASATEDGVRFVGVDVKESTDLALPYIQRHGIIYPVLLDESGSMAAAYGVPGYPTTYFLDRQGQIVDRHVGALTTEKLLPYLARIVE